MIQQHSKHKLVFVTTSLGTKWESYSQTLIELAYPSQQKVLIDGTRDWSPLKFLDTALKLDSDYTIHIDEDCFLYDGQQLDRLISYLDAHEDVVFAGTPDGGHYHRDHNPYACNLFFLVFKTAKVRQILSDNPTWTDLRFKESYREKVDLDISALDQSRISYDDFEGYYGFFWSIIESGKKIAYLHHKVDQSLLSTDVYFDEGQSPIARHMWYLRSWFATEPDPYTKVPHSIRYAKLKDEIHRLFGDRPDFSRTLFAKNFSRLMKTADRRASRKLRTLSKRIWNQTNSAV